MPGSSAAPDFPSEEIPVVAAVIRRDDAFLLALRPPGKRHGGLWEFPGGKVAADESGEEALARELREELGVELDTMGEVLFTARDPGTPYLVRFVTVSIRGGPRPLEHEEIRWVPPAELPALDLAPSDARFARELVASNPDRLLYSIMDKNASEETRPRAKNLPEPPRQEARYPGWLLPLLGGGAGWVAANWMGLLFGVLVGFLIWRSRA